MPKLEPVITRLDFMTGEDDDLDSEVIVGARVGSYANVNVVDCPPKDIALLEPEQVVTCCGTMNCICLLDTDFIYVTAFPQTDIDRP